MRITPRREETERVKAILESDNYADADSMAKALIKEVAEMLAMRDWFAGAMFMDDGKPFSPPYGPFASEADALAVFKKTGIGGHLRLAKVYAAGVLLANAQGKKGWPGYCTECGHSPVLHSSVGVGRGKCVLSICDCKQFKK